MKNSAQIDTLNRALFLLLSYSLITTTVAALGAALLGLPSALAGPPAALVALVLACLKGRVILSDYLGLRQAPAIRRGFSLALSGFTLLAAGLYLLPFVA